ncbi:MAG: DEAD/DEAH box helicase [Chitinophagales bacterium]
MEKFRELGLSENVLEALTKKGFETPSEIQEKTIPLLLKGTKDIVGQAQTGTGKTAAFGLPLIEQLDDNNRAVQALVLCPTRELAMQVAEEIISFKNQKRLYVQPVYGGQSYTIQINALKKGVQIVVGTPGRIRDHIDRGTLKLDQVTHVVLDEADEMLNMGFEEEVREILKSVPKERRMLLFSATMPPAILKLAKNFMRDYDLVEVQKQTPTTDRVDQMYFQVRDRDRFAALCRILDTEPEFYGIVFCKTKMETDNIADKLIDRGFDAEAIHGDVTQSQREMILKKFKMKKVNIMVATDVAARGIDVNDLTHVINYNLPQDPESYVHRIGRTGRAGKHGTAISIVSPSEVRDLLYIQKIAKTKIAKEEVPSLEDVIQTKTMKVKTELNTLMESGAEQDYLELAKELLTENGNAEIVVASLLRFGLKDTLLPATYHEIESVSASSNQRSDRARLFVAKGHKDNMNAGQVARFLAEETGVDANSINDIRVFDAFSFVSTNADDAALILAYFKKASKGKPLVTPAKEKPGQGGGGERRSGGENKGGYFKKGGDSRGERSRDFKSGGGNFGKKFGPKPERSQEKRSDFGFRNEAPARENAAPRNDSKAGRGGFEKKGPAKRTNKLTDYLDKPTNAAPAKKSTDRNEKPSFQFNDDLSW